MPGTCILYKKININLKKLSLDEKKIQVPWSAYDLLLNAHVPLTVQPCQAKITNLDEKLDVQKNQIQFYDLK